MTIDDKKIADITEKIVQEYRPEKIILFGSHVWGEPNESSDVDLLVIKADERSRLERQRSVRRLLSGFDVPIDVLVYTKAEIEEKVNRSRNLFLEDILRNGRVLYNRDGEHIRLLHAPAELVV